MKLLTIVAFASSVLLAGRAAAADPAQQTARPNIVLIMADDMGYSDIGCYGGEIRTPNLDRLAAGGLRFTQFYNSGRCCPTRASLMTGLHPHQTGIGHMTNTPTDPKHHDRGASGYRGFLNRRCVTLAEVLGEAGYHTLMAGKWHLGYHGQQKWPLQRGFDRFYGILSGAANYFDPEPPRGLTLDNEPIEPEGDDFYITDAFTDYAIEFLEQHEQGSRESSEHEPEQPFFLYLAYTAPHWPLHAPADVVERYRGTYQIGWDQLRQQRHQRMIQMGLVDAEWPLTPRDARPWEALSEEKKREMDLRMAIYAAQIDRMDQNIGRLVDALKRQGDFDNTLILFLVDNGGCAEGGELGRGPLEPEKLREHFTASYGRAWANASNTPFRRYKHHVHEGGIATPLIVHWPAKIDDAGALRRQPGYLPDVMPTLIEVAGAEYPRQYHGHEIPPAEGVSLMPAIASADARLQRDQPMCWEHEDNKAIRIGQWKLVTQGNGPWELYNLAVDRTEMNDLAGQRPARVERMAAKWQAWAERCHVQPKPSRRKR